MFFNTSEWWAKIKSVTYFVKNINEIRLLEHKKGNPFPYKWDENFAKKLPNKDLNKYYLHLRSLGFVPVKDRLGYTLYWEKKNK